MPDLMDATGIVDTPVPVEPMELNNPYRGKVVDLVNPYLTREGNRGGGSTAAGTEYTLWWLHRNPGRWALVGENSLGISRETAQNLGLRALYRGVGDRVYAQVPHPEAEPLAEALHRSASLPDALPRLTRDPFNWTKAELAEAAQIARDNLFPVTDRKEA